MTRIQRLGSRWQGICFQVQPSRPLQLLTWEIYHWVCQTDLSGHVGVTLTLKAIQLSGHLWRWSGQVQNRQQCVSFSHTTSALTWRDSLWRPIPFNDSMSFHSHIWPSCPCGQCKNLVFLWCMATLDSMTLKFNEVKGYWAGLDASTKTIHELTIPSILIGSTIGH